MLLNDPRLLIVDEPTAGLDPQERVSFRNLVGQLCEGNENRVILISTHIVDDLAYIASNIMVLNKGHLSYVGPAVNLAARANRLVYSMEMPASELATMKATHVVTSTKQGESTGTVVVRFLKGQGEIPPQARSVSPTLEDGYLAVLGKETRHVN